MKKKRKQPTITIINHFKSQNEEERKEIVTKKMSNIINNEIRNEIYSNSDPDAKE